MPGLFDRTRPDGDAIRRVKTMIANNFELPETTLLSVAELRCHEQGCPPVETVITARAADGGVNDWRIAKPVSDIDIADIELLGTQ